MWLRWAHEYVFSLNLAWIIVWIERVKTNGLDGRIIADYISALVGGAYQLVSPIGGRTILDQLIWSFVLGTIGFILLRLLSRFGVANFALRTIAGAVAIAAFPIATLFFGLTYPTCCAGIRVIGLTLEVIIVLICGTLFYLRKPLISRTLMIIALVFHFTILAWLTSSYVNIPGLVNDLRSSEYYHPWIRTLASVSLAIVFKFGFPLFGFLASLTWVRYLSRPSESIPTSS